MTAFITLPFPGVIRVGEEGEKLGLWDLITVTEGNVTLPRAGTVIFGAWSSVYDRILSVFDGTIGVCWTSSVVEVDLEPVELAFLHQIVRDPRIDWIWFGDPSWAEAVDKGFYAPYPVKVEERPAQPKRDIVTLFTPGKPKSNVLNQLLGVAIAQKDYFPPGLELHTNLAAIPPLPLPLKVNQRGWMPRNEYHELLASARVNLCVSHGETFSYQVAEATMLGTPSIVSEAVSWAPDLAAWHTSALEIGAGIIFALEREAELLDRWRIELENYASLSLDALTSRL